MDSDTETGRCQDSPAAVAAPFLSRRRKTARTRNMLVQAMQDFGVLRIEAQCSPSMLPVLTCHTQDGPYGTLAALAADRRPGRPCPADTSVAAVILATMEAAGQQRADSALWDIGKNRIDISAGGSRRIMDAERGVLDLMSADPMVRARAITALDPKGQRHARQTERRRLLKILRSCGARAAEVRVQPEKDGDAGIRISAFPEQADEVLERCLRGTPSLSADIADFACSTVCMAGMPEDGRILRLRWFMASDSIQIKQAGPDRPDMAGPVSDSEDRDPMP